MKKRVCHRVRIIGILSTFAVAIEFMTFAIAAEKNEARITQAIRNVQLLAPNAAPRPASINDNVRAGTAVRTASDSRAELAFTDRTLARLGANSVLSFGDREFDLASGSMLLYLPKRSGGSRINTALTTAAGASFTAMAPVHHTVGKYVDLYRQKAREGYAITFDLFERWMHSDVPLAGQLFQELSNDIFRYNRLMRGQLYIGGLLVSVQHIRCPVLNIIGAYDDVVHPTYSLPLPELIGSDDKANLLFPTGHIGVAVSAAAHKKLWPQVGQWLKEHA